MARLPLAGVLGGMFGGIARLLLRRLLSGLGELRGVGGDFISGLLLLGRRAADLVGEFFGVFKALLAGGEAGVGAFKVLRDFRLTLSRLIGRVGVATLSAFGFFAGLFSLRFATCSFGRLLSVFQ